MNSTEARAWASGGVVVVAELFAAQGGGAAAAARGVDVAAEIALDGGFREIGDCGWFGHGCLQWSGGCTPPIKCIKYSKGDG
jgi:hypothetical protein